MPIAKSYQVFKISKTVGQKHVEQSSFRHTKFPCPSPQAALKRYPSAFVRALCEALR